MPTEWTRGQSLTALAEGWDIFEHHGENGPEMQLQALHCAGRFADDADAWNHVYTEAKEHSALHMAALDFLSQTNPAEYRDIVKFCED